MTWGRWWSSASEARVQAARGMTEISAQPCSLELPECHRCPGRSARAPPAWLFSHTHETTSAQVGPQRLEGPAPLNHPKLLWTPRRPQDSQASEVPGTGSRAGQPANLGHQVPSESKQGQSRLCAPPSRRWHRDTHRLETCRTEQKRTDTCRHNGRERGEEKTWLRC